MTRGVSSTGTPHPAISSTSRQQRRQQTRVTRPPSAGRCGTGRRRRGGRSRAPGRRAPARAGRPGTGPRPVPSLSPRAPAVRPRTNRSKIESRSAGLTPGPSTSIRKPTRRDISPVPSAGTGKHNCPIPCAATLSRKPTWRSCWESRGSTTIPTSFCMATTTTGSPHGLSGN